MKNIKLFSGILIGLLIVFSCSSDDNSNSETPTLVGTWQPINEINYCSTGSQETYTLNNCEQNGRFKFNSNGTFTDIYYELGNNDECNSYTENGTWEINNSSLMLNSSNFTTFELTENTLKIGRELIVPGEPCNDGHLIKYEINYIRVE